MPRIIKYNEDTNTFTTLVTWSEVASNAYGHTNYFIINSMTGWCTTSYYDYVYKFYYDESTSTYTYISTRTTGRDTINGINYFGNKVFISGNVYILNPDMTKGELLNSNVYTSGQQIYTINDKYYYINSNLYTFDENTNTFTLVSLKPSSSYYYTQSNNRENLAYYMSTSKMFYSIIFNKDITKKLGITYNGNTYFDYTGPTFTSSDILLNKSYYTIQNQPVTRYNA